jgi:arsenate reductase
MSSERITIYHNPRCSKSRQTLAILQDAGVAPRVIEYLDHPPSLAELETIADQLGMQPEEFIRSKETAYAELDPAGADCSARELLEAMVAAPILIERPIVVRGDRAVIGRPPQNVHQLL